MFYSPDREFAAAALCNARFLEFINNKTSRTERLPIVPEWPVKAEYRVEVPPLP